MAFDLDGLVSSSPGPGRNNQWMFVTNDADTVVEAANYFNTAADRLVVGDQIFASIDVDGTPEMKNYIVSAISAGVVTVVLQATT